MLHLSEKYLLPERKNEMSQNFTIEFKKEASHRLDLYMAHGDAKFFREYLRTLDISPKEVLNTRGDSNRINMLLTPEEAETLMTDLIVTKGVCCDPDILETLPNEKSKEKLQAPLLKNLQKKEDQLDELLSIYRELVKKLGMPLEEKPAEKKGEVNLQTVKTAIVEKSKALYELYKDSTSRMNEKVAVSQIAEEIIGEIVLQLRQTKLGFEGPEVPQTEIPKREWHKVGLSKPGKSNFTGMDFFIVPQERSYFTLDWLLSPEEVTGHLAGRNNNPNNGRPAMPYYPATKVIEVVLDNMKKKQEANKSTLGSIKAWFLRLTDSSPDSQALMPKQVKDLVLKQTDGVGLLLDGKAEIPKETIIAQQLKSKPNPVHELLSWTGQLKGFRHQRKDYTDAQILKILSLLLKDRENVEKCTLNQIAVFRTTTYTPIQVPIISALTRTYTIDNDGLNSQTAFYRYHFDDEPTSQHQIFGDTRYHAAKMIYEAIKTHDIQVNWDRYSKVQRPVPLKTLEEQQAKRENERKQEKEKQQKREEANREIFFKYEALAEGGDPLGQYLLGRCYEKGIGVKESPEDALTWYVASARQKHPLGLFRFACCLVDGFGGVKVEEEKAEKYFKEAREKGYTQELEAEACRQLKEGVPEAKQEATSSSSISSSTPILSQQGSAGLQRSSVINEGARAKDSDKQNLTSDNPGADKGPGSPAPTPFDEVD